MAWSGDPADVEPHPARSASVDPPLPWEEFRALRDRALAWAGVREADSATDIAHGVAPVPEGVELPGGLLKEPRDLDCRRG